MIKWTLARLAAIIGIGTMGISQADGQQINAYYPTGIVDPSEVDGSFPGVKYTKEKTTVVGVVAEGSSGGIVLGDVLKQQVTLKAWKKVGETDLQFEELLVFRPTHRDDDSYKDIPAYSIVLFEIYLDETKERAVFVKGEFISEPAQDLIEAKKTLTEPVYLDSQRFGQFTLNKSIGWFEKEIDWSGEAISVMLNDGTDQEIGHELMALGQLADEWSKWKKLLDGQIVKDLLPLKNDAWLDDGESAMTAAQMMKTYKLESVTLYPDGTFEFWFADGDIFFGHSIMVSGSLKEGAKEASMQG